MWYARITISPAYSPAAPAFGCREKESKPVMVHNRSPKFLNISCKKKTIWFNKVNHWRCHLNKEKLKNRISASFLDLVTSSLFSGGKRMKICKGRPRHWHHFCCCIQFHCTRSQRNHAMAQREILRLKLMNVSKKFMLSVVPTNIRLTVIYTLESSNSNYYVCNKKNSYELNIWWVR